MRITFGEGQRVDAEYKGFTIRTDQPVHAGGSGSAPAPFDFFLASIGTCAGFYVRSFLEQRGLSTDGARVELRTIKDRERSRIGEIALKVVLPEGFPAKYERAIAAAIHACSVKKHILEPPKFSVDVEIGTPAAKRAVGG